MLSFNDHSLSPSGKTPVGFAARLTEAVARYLFKLMAYKDEYEVARLYTDGAFLKQVEAEFDGDDLRPGRVGGFERAQKAKLQHVAHPQVRKSMIFNAWLANFDGWCQSF